MSRVADDVLAIHLKAALAAAAPSLLDGLADTGWRRRQLVIGDVARNLVERLCCFEVRSADAVHATEAQQCLFPQNLGPIG